MKLRKNKKKEICHECCTEMIGKFDYKSGEVYYECPVCGDTTS